MNLTLDDIALASLRAAVKVQDEIDPKNRLVTLIIVTDGRYSTIVSNISDPDQLPKILEDALDHTEFEEARKIEVN